MLYGVCIFKMVIIDYVKVFCIFLFKNGYNINYRVFFFKLKWFLIMVMFMVCIILLLGYKFYK